MRTIRAALQAKLDAGNITLAYCTRVELTDGTILRITDHSHDLSISGDTYSAVKGFSSTSFALDSSMGVDSLDVEGLIDADGVPRADFVAGLFNGATIYSFITDWEDPVVDDVKMIKGWFGKYKLFKKRWEAEFVFLTDKLQTVYGDSYQVACQAELGDSRCKVRLAPSTWSATTLVTVRPDNDAGLGSIVKPTTQNGRYFECTTEGTTGGTEPTWNTSGTTNDGTAVWTAIEAHQQSHTVTSSADRKTLVINTLDQTDDWWNGGVLTFTSGNNNGFSMDIRDYVLSSTTVSLFLPMPFDIDPGDTVTLQKGCLKRLSEDCITIFNNRYNNRGFNRVPVDGDLRKVPDVS